MGTSVYETLPQLAGALDQLDCAVTADADLDAWTVRVTGGFGACSVTVAVPLAGEPPSPLSGDSSFALAQVPLLRHLLRHWMEDFELWDQLLPRHASHSLPGRALCVYGYGISGRRVAWRARELGMLVTVAEAEPQLLIAAAMDGFATTRPQDVDPRPGLLRVFTVPGATTQGIDLSGFPETIPAGLADEFTATTVLSLHVIHASPADGDVSPQDHHARLACLVDELFADMVAERRTDNYASNHSLWATYGW